MNHSICLFEEHQTYKVKSITYNAKKVSNIWWWRWLAKWAKGFEMHIWRAETNGLDWYIKINNHRSNHAILWQTLTNRVTPTKCTLNFNVTDHENTKIMCIRANEADEQASVGDFVDSCSFMSCPTTYSAYTYNALASTQNVSAHTHTNTHQLGSFVRVCTVNCMELLHAICILSLFAVSCRQMLFALLSDKRTYPNYGKNKIE